MTKFTPIAARSDIAAASDGHPLVSIALFCGIGLLLSLLVLLADMQLPGEWF